MLLHLRGEANMLAVRQILMNPLESYLSFSEPRRGWVYAIAAVMIASIAYSDWKIEEVSVGFLYVLPILMVSATLRPWQIVVVAIGCGVLRELFSPMYETPGGTMRVCIGAAGFALAGYFVSQLDQQRRSVMQHLLERERQMQLRADAERQLQVVVETSPLGIVTLDGEGRVLLANSSAHHLLRLEHPSLAAQQINAYLPILKSFLGIRDCARELSTVVETRGQRADGEAFLAHVWLSTFVSGSGLCLAAFIWDSSENLRDREGTGLDSMMATSRVLIGAMSHEIRNLAAAASAAYRELAPAAGHAQQGQFQALGAVIDALENIATSGLRLAAPSSAGVADLGMVLDEARVLIEASFRDEGSLAEWTIPQSLPLVEADHHSLLQVFLNLARNSERAMRGRAEKVLRVEVSVEDDLVRIRFRDSGPGVSNPDALFKPFQPGASATGLGLYISRAVLKSYGGDLHLEPDAQGGCFVVQLWAAEDRVAARA
jgi:two-component system sensor kinase FixL